MIAGFWNLEDVLKARMVCRSLCEALVEGVSPEQCGLYLSQELLRRQMYVLPSTKMIRTKDGRSVAPPLGLATQQPNKIASRLLMASSRGHSSAPKEHITVSDGGSLALDTMLRYFRIMKCLPDQMSVAFNKRYGRHCLPLKWNKKQQQTQIACYPNCSNYSNDCDTCTSSIPTLSSNTTESNKANHTSRYDMDYHSNSEETDENEEASIRTSQNEIDEEGLPVVYDKDLIQQYWSKERGALNQRWGYFVGKALRKQALATAQNLVAEAPREPRSGNEEQ